MAVKFRKDLDTLLQDLKCGGYTVRSVDKVSGSCGRTLDIVLEHDVVVNWDVYTESIWTEGPAPHSQRTETYLRRIYQGGWLMRKWAVHRLRIKSSPRAIKQRVASLLQRVRVSQTA